MEIIGAVPERRQHRARNDDAAGEGDESGVPEHLRFDRGQLLERQHTPERQCRVVLCEQLGEGEPLACGADQKDDGLHAGLVLLFRGFSRGDP